MALFDYDNDGYLDIYFVNSLTVDPAKSHQEALSTITTAMAPLRMSPTRPVWVISGFGMGVAVGDYNNDGFDDPYVTRLGPNYLGSGRTTAMARSRM